MELAQDLRRVVESLTEAHAIAMTRPNPSMQTYQRMQQLIREALEASELAISEISKAIDAAMDSLPGSDSAPDSPKADSTPDPSPDSVPGLGDDTVTSEQ